MLGAIYIYIYIYILTETETERETNRKAYRKKVILKE